MHPYSGQITLPFIGIGQPWGVAVGPDRTVYVTEFERDPNAPPGVGVSLWARVSTLAAGASGSERLPIAGLVSPYGVAVDATGNVYVADNNFDTPIRLTAGSSTPEVLPAVGKGITLSDVAVDAEGNVYLSYRPGLFSGAGHGGVAKIAAHVRKFFKPKKSELAFSVRFPSGVAVDARGAVYVVDGSTVWILAADSKSPVALPFTGLKDPTHVAVDGHGAVYVTDSTDGGRVVTLAAGSSAQGVLPFTGLKYPRGVAVDAAGSVYVADYGNRRVVQLPAAAPANFVNQS